MFYQIFVLVVLFFCYNVYNIYKKLYTNLDYIQAKQPFKNAVEYQTPIQLNVEKGAIPSWLHGIMYRIGPGRFRIRNNDGTDFVIRHAFDGLPFVHRFELNGKTQTLKYNSRMTAKTLEQQIQDGSLRGGICFGHVNSSLSISRWCLQVLYRTFNLLGFRTVSNAPDEYSIGVATTPNYPVPSSMKTKERTLVSKTDASLLQQLNAETLEPQAQFSYAKYDERLKGPISAAHHQWDSETKETFNFVLNVAPLPRLVVFSANDSGDITRLGDITHRSDGSRIRALYAHSFWLTKHYVIIPEGPLYIKDPQNLFVTGIFLSALHWDKDQPTYFHVFHRDGRGLVTSIPLYPGFFMFHTANAFEGEDGKLYLDCASFNRGDILHQIQHFGQPRMPEFDQKTAHKMDMNGITHTLDSEMSYGDLVRYCLDIKKQTATREDLAMLIEFPRFNHDMAFRPYQFVYGCRLHYKKNQAETISLLKVDLNNKGTNEFMIEGYSCSEPIFVPKPDGQNEDDGVLLTLANSEEKCYMLIIDATEMKELARFLIGQFTAITFHGSYVDHEFKTISPN